MNKLFLLVLLCFTVQINTTFAQGKVRAKEAIETLKNGVLILRLPSNTKKIDAMQKALDKMDADNPRRLRLERLLAEEKAETQRENEITAKIFRGEFDFAPVLVMYDYNMKKFLKGERENIFLDENLALDPSIKLTTDQYLFLRVGQPSYATSSGVKSIIVVGSDNKDLARPFPYAQAIEHAGFLVNLFFNKEKAFVKTMTKAVGKLNNNVHIFAQKNGLK